MDHKGIAFLFFAILLAVHSAPAAPVETSDATRAATAWIAKNPAPLDDRFAGREASDVKTFEDADGTPVFHVVMLEGGGFVVTSADDEISPIVLFSASEAQPDLASGSPLFDFLAGEMAARMEALDSAAGRFRAVGGHADAAAVARGDAKAEWAALLAYDPDAAARRDAGVSSISDVRVPKLLGSQWDQEDVNGYNVYNYYTPYNYCCGCVATAMAQIMRYHQYPSGYVTPRTYTCSVDNYETSKTMLGGYYDWANMPLVPANASLTTTMRQAIGRLTYDCGVATEMDWGYDGSGTPSHLVDEALRNAFGYASAKCETSYNSGFGTDAFRRLILANLDARCPVALGIASYTTGSRKNGHAIVADGYGYSGSTLYVHLNMGWSGSSDLWYAIPNIGTGYSFDTVDCITYNIFPDETGDIISGRILSRSGRPVSGAAVELYDDYGNYLQSTTSNDKGIYHFKASAGNYYTVYASTDGSDTSSTSLYLSSYDRNAWGQNLTLDYEPPERLVTLREALDNSSLTFTTGGYAKWYGRTARNFDGKDCAQSGRCADGTSSWISTKVSGAGTISFKWKTSSEADFDFLELWVDGKKKARISGRTNWMSKSVAIAGSGTHTITWRYVKDGSYSEGEDCGWVDVVTWTRTIPLSTALDTSLSFVSGGYAKWRGENYATWDGVDAARSGAIADDRTSWMRTTVTGSGTLSFRWMTSSEAGYDWLELWVDGRKKARISGRTPWLYKSVRITGKGRHSITWCYKKDGSYSSGCDSGFVDRVRWTR